MTYKELADLIFPNVKEIKYYESHPFSKWYFLNDDLIFENEQIPQIPQI